MGRTANSVDAMYRSVPPRPFSYTFSDILQTSLRSGVAGRKITASRSKTAPVSSNTPEEYAERFKSRPTTRPAVIDLGCGGVRMYAGGGTVCRFNKPGFPAVRTRAGRLKIPAASEPLPPHPLTERGTACTTSSLHLAPLVPLGRPPEQDPAQESLCSLHSRKANNNINTNTNTTTRSHTPDLPPARHTGLRSSASSRQSGARSPGGSHHHHHHHHHHNAFRGDPADRSAAGSHPVTTPGTSDSQWQELSSSKLSTLDALTFPLPAQGVGEPHPGYAQGLARGHDYDDLSELPKPKRILPRRDLPWVFRFKVKKELNALSKIMASKPAGPSGVAAVGPSA